MTDAISYTQVREYLDWLDRQEKRLAKDECRFRAGNLHIVAASTNLELSMVRLARAKFLNIMAVKKESE